VALFLNPAKESSHSCPLAPHKLEKLSSVEVIDFSSEKGFQAPTDIRTLPRAEPISLGDDPVVANGGQHASVLRQLPGPTGKVSSMDGHLILQCAHPRRATDEAEDYHYDGVDLLGGGNLGQAFTGHTDRLSKCKGHV
jgi:hypothetical protein